MLRKIFVNVSIVGDQIIPVTLVSNFIADLPEVEVVVIARQVVVTMDLRLM